VYKLAREFKRFTSSFSYGDQTSVFTIWLNLCSKMVIRPMFLQYGCIFVHRWRSDQCSYNMITSSFNYGDQTSVLQYGYIFVQLWWLNRCSYIMESSFLSLFFVCSSKTSSQNGKPATLPAADEKSMTATTNGIQSGEADTHTADFVDVCLLTCILDTYLLTYLVLTSDCNHNILQS